MQAGRASLAATLGVVLMAVATLAPPAVLLLLLFLLWRRWGQRWWHRLLEATARA